MLATTNITRLVAVGLLVWRLPAAVFADPKDESVTIIRDEDRLVTQVDITAEGGRVSLDTLAQALAEVKGYDPSVLDRRLLPGRIDLHRKRTKLLLAAVNAALPEGVSLRIIRPRRDNDNGRDEDQGEPILRVTIDRARLLESKRQVKAALRRETLELLDRSGGREKRDYGLRLDPNWQQAAGDKPLVVLIHGFNSTPQRSRPLLDPVREAGFPSAVFAYPNDQSLDYSAGLLSRQLKQFAEKHPRRPVALLTYSMGGLVARRAVEDPKLYPANVRRLIMVAPPNGGSRLAELAVGLDLWEHGLRPSRRKAMDRLYASWEDGLAEAKVDLRPGSVFLTKLNRRKRNDRVRYTIFLGTGGPLSADDVAAVRKKLASLTRENRYLRLAGTKWDAALADVDEVIAGRGDGVVAVRRGRLEGVDDTLVLDFRHDGVLDDPDHETVRKLRADILRRLRK